MTPKKKSKMSKFYITTPIYYVNASPHIGHAYTSIICDCLSRFKRLKGDEVFYLTGTDEHGEKIKKAAEESKEDTQAFTDRVMGNFKHLWEQLNVSYDYFIRTTDPAHKKSVRQVIKILYDKGDIYKANYRSFYCMPCESFWTDTQVKEAESKCPICKREVEQINGITFISNYVNNDSEIYTGATNGPNAAFERINDGARYIDIISPQFYDSYAFSLPTQFATKTVENYDEEITADSIEQNTISD